MKMSAGNNAGIVLLVVGPTGVGKTRFSIELGKRINGEVISADSRYLYKGMDIGTAKPTSAELASVRHHLINVADPDETWSLPVFLEKTLGLFTQIQERGSIPIVTGGTGQYIRALTEGWRVPELKPNEELRKVLTEWGDEIGARNLHQKLAILDVEAAKIIDATNMRRTVRALEVIFSTGYRFSELRRKDGPAFNYKIIGLAMGRDLLYKRVDERIETMLNMGFEKEVKELLAKGFDSSLPSMSAIGYPEMIGYIRGDIDLETVKSMMRRKTRQLIRRQANWFKPTDDRIYWYEVDDLIVDRVMNDLTSAGVIQ